MEVRKQYKISLFHPSWSFWGRLATARRRRVRELISWCRPSSQSSPCPSSTAANNAPHVLCGCFRGGWNSSACEATWAVHVTRVRVISLAPSGPLPHVSGIFESATLSFRIQNFPVHTQRIQIEFACPHASDDIRIHSRETRPTRCAAILVYCSARDWTRFCYVIFFPFWRAD